MSKQMTDLYAPACIHGASHAASRAVALFDVAKLPAPDEMGFFIHPDVPGTDEGHNSAALCEDLGYVSAAVFMEDDAPEELFEAWSEQEDQSSPARWMPTPPKGDGWILVAKFDTESGPCAMFVKQELVMAPTGFAPCPGAPCLVTPKEGGPA